MSSIFDQESQVFGDVGVGVQHVNHTNTTAGKEFKNKDPTTSIGFYDKEIGKTVFLTKAEAEQKLKGLNKENQKT